MWGWGLGLRVQGLEIQAVGCGDLGLKTYLWLVGNGGMGYNYNY